MGTCVWSKAGCDINAILYFPNDGSLLFQFNNYKGMFSKILNIVRWVIMFRQINKKDLGVE